MTASHRTAPSGLPTSPTGIHHLVLPIDTASGRRVTRLERDGYEVRYREFDGGREVPPEIAHEAVEWFVA